MQRAVRLYGTSIGKKVAMAVTGVLLVLFLIAHMAGNLKMFQGQKKFDAYAAFLREVGAPVLGHGEALWLFRAVLIASVTLHVVAAAQLWSRSRRARRVPYRDFDDLSFSYASRTMRWGGVILALFVVYHLLHLTSGTAHPDFDHASAYRNVVVGFQVWWVVLAYVAAVVGRPLLFGPVAMLVLVPLLRLLGQGGSSGNWLMLFYVVPFAAALATVWKDASIGRRLAWAASIMGALVVSALSWVVNGFVSDRGRVVVITERGETAPRH